MVWARAGTRFHGSTVQGAAKTVWGCVCSVQLSSTLWSIAHQALYWVGCDFLLQEIFMTQGSAGGFFTTESPEKPTEPVYKEVFWKVLNSAAYNLVLNKELWMEKNKAHPSSSHLQAWKLARKMRAQYNLQSLWPKDKVTRNKCNWICWEQVQAITL